MPELVPSSTSITNFLRWLGSWLVVYLSVAITAGFFFAAAALIGIPFTRDAGAQILRANQFVSKSVPDKKRPTPETDIGDLYPVQQSTGQARSLDPHEVDALVKQGQQFVAAGDFVSARLVFQRAAEAGSASAALALGASYDPVVLSRLGARNVDADVSKARAWYQKARELGAPEGLVPRLRWAPPMIPSRSHA